LAVKVSFKEIFRCANWNTVGRKVFLSAWASQGKIIFADHFE